jgi:hypothetical protein
MAAIVVYLASDRGIGRYFLQKLSCDVMQNSVSDQNGTIFRLILQQQECVAIVFLFLLCLSLCYANTTGPAPQIGEAQRINKNQRRVLIGAANAPDFAYRRSECAPLRL